MDAKTIQGVMYIVFIIILTFILYGYIMHLYRSEKKGKRNYEKYGKMALDDELSSPPVEPLEEEKSKESK
ncbi:MULTISPECIES: cytochrome c oxidase, cbb3-type, CcoQ subunit [Nitratiruptor]|uniref:Cytochrome c oxidase cbb3-type subunit 4 n=1 Tax=Nitratiruptor tergarcus DSM 16512 TaxID=1069081 RepID=A0A1W1WQD5_9BACT|nr:MULTISPECIES: cytochrome c oxidase, cbb3-type, CcoQ subunit [Nitratiruptor]SMC08456.1 cytochrome c oxidase cbb3-type subunit 4 [Nitratiruptor tergarcus DSM 16512]